ncbi:MAG: 23S rRNA (adenine(2503)-C(2))-methyltransferase RlmN [Myxococcota bacterium]
MSEEHELPAAVATNLTSLARFPEEWETALTELGEPKYRAAQVFRWLQRRGVFAPAEMTDLALGLREKLAGLGLRSPVEVERVQRSQDGTRKLLLSLFDGGRVECVLIPMTRLDADADASAAVEDETETDEADEKTKVTLCISTQHGCAMGCRFCASGRAGLLRGLKAAEIVAQVLVSKRYLEPHEELKNLVFMGMGEPLHHYDETARALRLLMHSEGLGMSPRRITVSTVGLVPGIQKLGRDFDGKVGLAVSLHAPNDTVRSSIMPMNDRFPIRELMQTLRAYPLPRRRRITIEYTLINGVNDGREHAAELIALLRGLPVKINLIPMNPVEGSGYGAPSNARVADFQRALSAAGYSCFVRTRRGDEVDAACGQLALAPELVELRRREKPNKPSA